MIMLFHACTVCVCVCGQVSPLEAGESIRMLLV